MCERRRKGGGGQSEHVRYSNTNNLFKNVLGILKQMIHLVCSVARYVVSTKTIGQGHKKGGQRLLNREIKIQ